MRDFVNAIFIGQRWRLCFPDTMSWVIYKETASSVMATKLAVKAIIPVCWEYRCFLIRVKMWWRVDNQAVTLTCLNQKFKLNCNNQLLNFLPFTSKHLNSHKSLPVCYPNMIKGLLITGKINIPYLSGISGGLKWGNLLKM